METGRGLSIGTELDQLRRQLARLDEKDRTISSYNKSEEMEEEDEEEELSCNNTNAGAVIHTLGDTHLLAKRQDYESNILNNNTEINLNMHNIFKHKGGLEMVSRANHSPSSKSANPSRQEDVLVLPSPIV